MFALCLAVDLGREEKSNPQKPPTKNSHVFGWWFLRVGFLPSPQISSKKQRKHAEPPTKRRIIKKFQPNNLYSKVGWLVIFYRKKFVLSVLKTMGGFVSKIRHIDAKCKNRFPPSTLRGRVFVNCRLKSWVIFLVELFFWLSYFSG